MATVNQSENFNYKNIIEQSDAKDVHELIQDIDGGESGTEDRLSEEMTSALTMTLSQTGLTDIDDIKEVALGIFHDMEQKKIDEEGKNVEANGVLVIGDTASTNDVDGQLSKEFAQEYLGLDPSKGEIREFIAQSASETVETINGTDTTASQSNGLLPQLVESGVNPITALYALTQLLGDPYQALILLFGNDAIEKALNQDINNDGVTGSSATTDEPKE